MGTVLTLSESQISFKDCVTKLWYHMGYIFAPKGWIYGLVSVLSCGTSEMMASGGLLRSRLKTWSNWGPWSWPDLALNSNNLTAAGWYSQWVSHSIVYWTYNLDFRWHSISQDWCLDREHKVQNFDVRAVLQCFLLSERFIKYIKQEFFIPFALCQVHSPQS